MRGKRRQMLIRWTHASVVAFGALVTTSASGKAGDPMGYTLIAPVGEVAFHHFGASVASVGDVNLDGFSDVIIGTSGHLGRAYAYLGGPGMDTTSDLKLMSQATIDYFGSSVATAGDVNGDGFADVIVGAPLGGAGSAYVYYGGRGDWSVADLALTGEVAGDGFGVSVASAGDVNGDGFADMIIGAYQNDEAGEAAGRAYVFHGGPDADSVADLTLTGASEVNFFGFSVSSAGDMNGDGFADVIIGADGNDEGGIAAGRAYVYFGGSAMDALPDLILTGRAAGDRFGISVGSVGDVNDDGFGDVIVGAYLDDAGGLNAGSAFVFYGGPAPDSLADLTLTGKAEDGNFGYAVGAAGDVNGDGFTDLMVGGYRTNRVYLYSGGPGLDAVADLILTGDEPGDAFGTAVASAGDVNGDGSDEIVVGAPQNDAGGVEAGRAYVITVPHMAPISVALQDARTDSTGVRLSWVVQGAYALVSTVYRRTSASDWVELGRATPESGTLIAYDDTDVLPGDRYAYRLFVQIGLSHGTSSEVWVTVPKEAGSSPTLHLDPAFPNPVHGTTNLNFVIPQTGHTKLAIYDVRGRRVTALLDGELPAGWRLVTWSGRDPSGQQVASGTYFVRLESQDKVQTRKVVVAH